MRLEYLVRHLEDAGAGQGGLDLFVHRLPEQATAATVLLNILQPGFFDMELQAAGWDHARVTLVSRDATPHAAETRLRAVAEALLTRVRPDGSGGQYRIAALPDLGLPPLMVRRAAVTRRYTVYPRTMADLWEATTDLDVFSHAD